MTENIPDLTLLVILEMSVRQFPMLPRKKMMSLSMTKPVRWILDRVLPAAELYWAQFTVTQFVHSQVQFSELLLFTLHSYISKKILYNLNSNVKKICLHLTRNLALILFLRIYELISDAYFNWITNMFSSRFIFCIPCNCSFRIESLLCFISFKSKFSRLNNINITWGAQIIIRDGFLEIFAWEYSTIQPEVDRKNFSSIKAILIFQNLVQWRLSGVARDPQEQILGKLASGAFRIVPWAILDDFFIWNFITDTFQFIIFTSWISDGKFKWNTIVCSDAFFSFSRVFPE